MAKPELTDGRRVPFVSHAHAVRALVLAALIGGSTSAHTAEALADCLDEIEHECRTHHERRLSRREAVRQSRRVETHAADALVR